jgi:hypothetical protein
MIKATRIIHPLAHCRQTALCSVADLFVRPLVFFFYPSACVRIEIRPAGTDLTTKSCCFEYSACFRFVSFSFYFRFLLFSERNFTTWHWLGYSRRSQRVWRGLFFESASEFSGIDEYVNDQVRRFIQMEGTGPHWAATEHLVTAKRGLGQHQTDAHQPRSDQKQPRPARRLDTWLVYTYASSALPVTGQHPGKRAKIQFPGSYFAIWKPHVYH